ncbi:MAG: hypothetical protein EON49_01465 [Acidovorax sp.]|nr:MAG: hypothetical protein EON49_01465 [Acidovorax sp.]
MTYLPADNGDTAIARVRHRALHVHDILAHAARVHGPSTVSTVTPQGLSHDLTYAELAQTAWSSAQYLQDRGIRAGDPIANIGLSGADQMAWLYGALSIGAVSHLVNPQHPAEDVVQLMRVARPRLMLHDTMTAPLAQALSSHERSIPLLDMAERVGDTVPSKGADSFAEDAAAFVCYSSGTTGLPKTVQYTHRSTVLHAWACALPDAMHLSAQDRVMPLMQTYHAAAWGAPFVCPLVGAALVLVPPERDPARWFRWIEDHRITVLGAVTAHWMALAQYMRSHQLRFSTLKRTVVAGSRLAPQVARFIAEGLGVEVCHAWGMTETSPLATIERYDRGSVLGHGKPVFGIELAVRDAAGAIGAEGHGELLVRGHWVAHRSQADGEWLPTGDLACLHADSQLEVIDRLDEAVTATGVTVSSALVEYHARTVDGVADAALLAPARPGEGCTLVWVGNSVAAPAAVETCMAGLLAAQFGGWSPDAFIVVDALPYTPSAKVQKRILRQQVAAAPNAHAMPADIPLSISSLQP